MDNYIKSVNCPSFAHSPNRVIIAINYSNARNLVNLENLLEEITIIYDQLKIDVELKISFVEKRPLLPPPPPPLISS